MNTVKISDLVKEGAIHGDVYKDEEIFQKEMKNIFENTWVYVAQLPSKLYL